MKTFGQLFTPKSGHAGRELDRYRHFVHGDGDGESEGPAQLEQAWVSNQNKNFSGYFV